VKSTGIWKKHNGWLSDPEEDALRQATHLYALNGLIEKSTGVRTE